MKLNKITFHQPLPPRPPNTLLFPLLLNSSLCMKLTKHGLSKKITKRLAHFVILTCILKQIRETNANQYQSKTLSREKNCSICTSTAYWTSTSHHIQLRSFRQQQNREEIGTRRKQIPELQHAKYPPHMRWADVKENQFSACSVSVTSSSLS